MSHILSLLLTHTQSHSSDLMGGIMNLISGLSIYKGSALPIDCVASNLCPEVTSGGERIPAARNG